LLPLNPLLAGGVLWLFGPWSATASLVLLGLSLGQVLAGYLLVRLVFVRMGAHPQAVRWGTAFLLLVPPFVPQETLDFRYWEGGSALCLVATNMLAMIAMDDRGRLRRRDLIAIPVLFAVTFFVSPPAGLAVGGCWAIVALRRLPPASSVALAGATATALVLIVTPWRFAICRCLASRSCFAATSGSSSRLPTTPLRYRAKRRNMSSMIASKRFIPPSMPRRALLSVPTARPPIPACLQMKP
jgi:hypothetical protein